VRAARSGVAAAASGDDNIVVSSTANPVNRHMSIDRQSKRLTSVMCC